MKKSSVALILIFFLVILDQFLKIWVKTTMLSGESFSVLGNWFYIKFIENNGMAFGISFGENIGKPLLSIIRIGMVGFIIYYLFTVIKKKQANWTKIIILSLITAGAIGNTIDSVCYGVIWNDAPLLYGQVVDMFSFELFPIPRWIPFFGGELFFPAIFNVADSCLTLGIIAAMIWNKNFFASEKQKETQQI